MGLGLRPNYTKIHMGLIRMKFSLIIAGSRSCNHPQDFNMLVDYIQQTIDFNNIKEVVSGKAKGADMLGEGYAKKHNIPIKQFLANWNKYGNKAGPIRNKQMADYAATNNGVLIVIWDGSSRGTISMMNEAKKLSIPIHIIKPNRFTTNQGQLF